MNTAELSYDVHARDHFHAMPADQQHGAIRCLAAAGHSDYTIANATGLSVEMVRRLLSEREARS